MAGSKRTKNSELPKGQKNTQRDRLLAAMIAVTNRDGYANASVAAVASEAKVSKPTFYEYFRSREACFLGALSSVHERLMLNVRSDLAGARTEDALTIAISTVSRFAGEEPELARFMIDEPLAAGSESLNARDRGIAEIATAIEDALDAEVADTALPNVPVPIIVGGTFRLLAARLRRGERVTSALVRELTDWLRSYRVPANNSRWRSVTPVDGLERSTHLPSGPLRPPATLPQGRSRLSDAEVQQNRRLRVMFAAATLAEEKGYAKTTTTEIAKRARVDLRAFYGLFSEKQDAFMAVHELGFQELMAVAAVAFFAGATWPERSWEAGRAFTQFLEVNPTIANVGFVEAYAVGSAAAQRVEDSHVAFTIFLQEGLQHATEPPSRVALDAIVNSIFEMVYRQVRSTRPLQISGLLPNIAQLWLTPFLGPTEANRFIDLKLSKNKPPKRPRKTQ